MKISSSRGASVLSLLSVMLMGLLVLSALPQHAAPQAPATGIVLELDPAQSMLHWTLGTTLHAVHGTFALEKGAVQLDPATRTASGEIVVHAASGDSGNDSRDKKMHKDVLQSDRYPEIIFRPDRFEGKLPQEGPCSLQVHGTFGLHGAEHEMTMSVQGELSGDRWTGRAKFGIPFIDWGLKNPSNFFLKVNHTVDIDVELKGKVQIMAAPQA